MLISVSGREVGQPTPPDQRIVVIQPFSLVEDPAGRRRGAKRESDISDPNLIAFCNRLCHALSGLRAFNLNEGQEVMPKFITIGYGDRAGYDSTPQPVRNSAHQQDAKLVSEGAVTGIAGKPVQVRNPDATGVKTVEGPFMTSKLPIAGFSLIEADDMADAITKVSTVPCAVAHGVVEIWPLE